MRAHRDDADQRNVVLVWRRVEFAALSAPMTRQSAVTRFGAPGLGDVRGLGLVERSALVRALAAQNSVHPSHDQRRHDSLDHYIVPLKECVAEVVAGSVETQRYGGSTLEAAAAALLADRL